jgi:uncharacterized damage-inducible protein DinB
MRKEIDLSIAQLKDAYEGDPWFGRNIKELLNEVDEKVAFQKLNNQHSILELVWHMITWREFTINCLQPSPNRNLKYFEELDWREIDHNNAALWPEGLLRLEQTQTELLRILDKQDDSLLENLVKERQYNFRKLVNGLIQHDIYHLGQIAYINKAVKQR